MSLDVALTARATLRPAVEGAIPGKTPKLYFELVPSDAVEPYVHMQSSNQSPGDRIVLMEQKEYIYLHIWTQGVGDMARLEKAVEYLFRWHGPDYGDIINPKWRRQSATRLAEGAMRLHTTQLYEVTYWNRNHLLPR